MRLKRTCLVLTLLISAGVLRPVAAQRSPSPNDVASVSHRKLTLPNSGSTNFRQQLEQLRQLQAMWQNGTAEEQDNAQGLSTIEKALAENLMRQTLKGGNTPKLDDLPKDVVSKVMSNQAARRDIQDLLQKFRQDGLMPQGNAQGGGASLPGRQSFAGTAAPDNSARVLREPGRNRRTDDDQTDMGQPPGFSPNPAGRNPATEPRQNNGGRGDSRSDGPPGKAPSQPGQNFETGPISRFPGADVDNRGGRSPSEQGANSTSSNPLDRQPGESAADHARRMGDYLDEKLREKTRQQNGDSRTNSGVDRRPFESGGSRQNASGRQGTGGAPPVSMSDLLNEFGGLSGQRGTSSGGNSSRERNSNDTRQNQNGRSQQPPTQPSRQDGRRAGSNSGQGKSAPSARDTSGLQESAKQTLKNRGLKAAIHQVMNSARREIRGSSGRATEATGGMSEGVRKALVDALSGISDDVVRLAQDARSGSSARSSSRNGGSNAGGSNAGGSHAGDSSSTSWIGSIRDSINNSGSPASPTSGGGGISPPDLSAGGGSLLSFLIIVAVAGGIVWWLMKSGQLTAQAAPARLTAARIGAIRSRRDVVEAFHLIALDPRHGAEPWWHHEQVRVDLSTRLPSQESSVSDLAAVYEQARYLPDSVELNETQLATARDAIERCRP
ncbi:MAG: hypothetical protein NXI04_20365 [Planctomycetaceae bacterium]|nr:hypothetical protein [Planctomycetaceae bacterium]